MALGSSTCSTGAGAEDFRQIAKVGHMKKKYPSLGGQSLRLPRVFRVCDNYMHARSRPRTARSGGGDPVVRMTAGPCRRSKGQGALIGQSWRWLQLESATGIDQVTVTESASLPAISIYSSATPSSVLAEALIGWVFGKPHVRLHN